MTRNSIVNALQAVEADAQKAHQEQLARIREMGDLMGRGDGDIVEEFEKAVAEYEEGRRRLADKIAEAAARISGRRAPASRKSASRRTSTARRLPHEAHESLKLY